MDIAHAFVHWCNCDGEQKCGQCPLHDPDPDVFSICDCFNEAAVALENKARNEPLVMYKN